jgi:phage terminase large subunit-like protein
MAVDLRLAPEVVEYMESRGIPMPTCPPKWITPSPGEAPGSWFDADRVDLVMRTFQALRHTQGRWAGQSLRPDPWQVGYVLAPIFGFVHRDDNGDIARVIRSVFIDVARRNGKTTLSGGIALYMMAADREPGAQVVCAATTKDQASKLFTPIKQLAESSPTLMRHLVTRQGKILHPASGSYFQVVSADAPGLHGSNLAAGVLDELHLHKTGDLLKAIETGTGSRVQPLVFTITTADDGKVETPYAQRRSLIEQLSRRTLQDYSYYGVIWAAEEEDDPFAEATWAKANPGYPISPSRAYLQQAATLAQNSPADFADYQRLHLGIRTKQQTRYIGITEWDASAGTRVDDEDLEGQVCYGGLDLASTSDLCAYSLLFPQPNGAIVPRWWMWTPEANVKNLDKQTANMASVWIRQGLITVTPGNVADYDFIEKEIVESLDRYEVMDIGYDPWNSSQLVNNLSKAGAPLTLVRQGYLTMSPLCKEMLREIRIGHFWHDNHPVLRWMIDGFAVAMDPSGNVKPDRSAVAASGYKMDGLVASLIAMQGIISQEPDLDIDQFKDL